MILKMYITGQSCYGYMFEPHFRWYESMIVLTLLMPSMYLVSLPYIYIVYYGLFHPYHDEGPLSLLYGPYSKKTTCLYQIKQSLSELQLKGLWVIC